MKFANRPLIGSFYILGDSIYYNLEEGGLEHHYLWMKLVDIVFGYLNPDDKKILKSATYCTDRGRTLWTGAWTTEPVGDGEYILYITPGCKPHVNKIKKVFNLLGVKVKIEMGGHYINSTKDEKIFQDILEKNSSPEYKDTEIFRRNVGILAKVINKLKG
jgi:hypothetical protein